MDEYISREALLADLAADYGNWIVCNDTDESYRQGVRDNFDDTIRLINELPAADVQPVKHGRWELITQNKFTGTKTLRCTYCKNYFVVRDDTLNAGRGDANFCPNCGSKNRKDGDSDA